MYTTLREAEYRSVSPIPYWNVPLLRWIVPRQRRCMEALQVINVTLDELIAKCKALVDEEDAEFEEEFLSEADPSILHFLVASGEGGRGEAGEGGGAARWGEGERGRAGGHGATRWGEGRGERARWHRATRCGARVGCGRGG